MQSWAQAILAGGVTLLASNAWGFSREEADRIRDYWREPGRYRTTTPADADRNGRFQVRLTPEGSKWIWDIRAKLKIPKGTAKLPNAAWQKWIDQRVAKDRAEAAALARMKNHQTTGKLIPVVGVIPECPPQPQDLMDLVGEAPPLAECAEPIAHELIYPDGTRLVLVDNVPMAPQYAFYRFREGIRDFGQKMKDMPRESVDKILQEAGVSDRHRRVFQAVSLLEGGFDSINTYDTGFVSAGFIQFACLTEGGHSLGQVLLDQKRTAPETFERDFRRIGLDVDDRGLLVALKIGTGDVTKGNEAALRIIEDKRLAGAFVVAGKNSPAYRTSQLRVATRMYFPENDSLAVFVNGLLVQGKVSDVIKSEAGLATLMDLKVHTGNLGNLGGLITEVMLREGLKTIAEASPWEADIIKGMKHRGQFLTDKSLSQPPTPPRPAQEP